MSFRLSLLAMVLGLLTLQASAVEAQNCYTLRPEPLTHNFVLVIDRSGSMDGVPLQQAIAAANVSSRVCATPGAASGAS